MQHVEHNYAISFQQFKNNNYEVQYRQHIFVSEQNIFNIPVFKQWTFLEYGK